MRHFVVTCVCVAVAAGTVGCGSSDAQNNPAQGGNVNKAGANQAGSSQAGASQSTQGGGANGGSGNSNQGGGANGGNGTGVASGGTGSSGAANTGGTSGSTSVPTGSRLGAYDSGACALTSAGDMVCWGSIPPSTETMTPAGTFTSISVSGGQGLCGINASGGMECFAEPNTAGGWTGACGLDSSGYIDCTNGASLSVSWSRVTGGGDIVCGITSGGTPACSGNFLAQQPPANVAVTDISAGEYHACAIRRDTKELECWAEPPTSSPAGCFDPAQLGEDVPPSGQYVQVVSGWYHSCAIGVDGTVTCWGAGSPNDTSGYDSCYSTTYNYGQGRPPAGTFKTLAAGGLTTCGIKTDGTLSCWGAGTTTGDCANDLSACGQALPPSGTFIEVAIGSTHACAMTAAGKVQCWGSNTGGRATPPAELQ